jgi:hypothetical protein
MMPISLSSTHKYIQYIYYQQYYVEKKKRASHVYTNYVVYISICIGGLVHCGSRLCDCE